MNSSTPCPPSADLKALLHGLFEPAEEAALSNHLEGCRRCQHALQELAASGASWAGLAHHLGDTPPPPEAVLLKALASLSTPSPSSETLPAEPADGELSLDFLDPPQRPGHLGRLDGYEVLEVVGRGGMGVVLKALDPALERVVAVKILTPQLAGLASARSRFLREARTAARLEHDNIVTIHAVAEFKGLPFLVMQLVDGVSLEERLQQGPLPLAEIVRIAAATARGLEAAHAQGIIHRDIKPANILLEANSGRVKITDFGLARAVDDASLTQSGVIAGTPQYMAPEQARAEAVDHRADLFSLGSVLYAMCTGRPPFEGSMPLAILRRVADEMPPPVRQVNEAIPRWLEAIVARLHAREAAERFSSAAEVADLLERHLAQLAKSAALAAVPQATPVADSPPRRRRRHVVLLGLAAVLTAAAVGVAALPLAGVLLRPHAGGQGETATSSSPVDREELARQARQVLATHCHRCHGENGTVEGGFNYLMDPARLVVRKKIRPGQPDRSRLLRRVVEGEMPPEGEKPRPGPEEIALLERWIAAGAPPFGPTPSAQPFLSLAHVGQDVHRDLAQRKERDRRFTRYFTLTHLFNAGLSGDELQTYRNGLSKLLNSLSWKKDIVIPVPVDAARTVLRIDLRDYGWTEAEWEALLAAYPYSGDATSGGTPAHLRGDWFVAQASRPPLYHELLRLPSQERELEKLLHIDVEADIRGERVARAGFNDSGVSRNNRLIERHETPYGAYWKSYDFAKNTAEQNLFERPLGPGTDERSFRHAGGEIIFNLPNGLQGYLLVNGRGERLDKGPTEIVSDPRRPDRAVENGLSCMACHARGLNPKADKVRAVVEAAAGAFAGKEERDTILALYPAADVFADLLRKDSERFQGAVTRCGAQVGATEPIMALAAQFEAPLDLARAAAEVGLRPADFLANLRRSPAIERALGPLEAPGGTVSRETFVRVFPDMAHDWAGSIFPAVEGQREEPVRDEPPGHTAPLISEPKLSGRTEIELPEPFAQVRTGGAGRYLIFHLKKAKKLAVFDVSRVKIVYQVDVPEDVLYAAGRDKLLILQRGQKLLKRLDLHSGRSEKIESAPEGILAAHMGCNSNGPLLLFVGGKLIGWDIEAMKQADIDDKGLGGDPKFLFRSHVSADGRSVTVWHAGLRNQQYLLVHLGRPKNTLAFSPDVHSSLGHWALPNADGSLVFRAGGGIYDGDMRPLPAEAFKNSVLLPSEDPRFFLAVAEESDTTNKVSLCTSAERAVVFTVGGIEKMTRSSMNTRWGNVEGEPRVHYLPSANVLVSLPESNDRVVLRAFNLLESLEQSGKDYLFVLSRPERKVAAGSEFVYQMDVKSKAGGLLYKLESGPRGMNVSAAGVVRWQAPAQIERPARVILTIRSASGKEVQHAFDLVVESP